MQHRRHRLSVQRTLAAEQTTPLHEGYRYGLSNANVALRLLPRRMSSLGILMMSESRPTTETDIMETL